MSAMLGEDTRIDSVDVTTGHRVTVTHPRLRRTPHRRRPGQTRDHPLPQALHRPRDLRQPAPPSHCRPSTRTDRPVDLTNIGASSGSTAPCRPSSPTTSPGCPTTTGSPPWTAGSIATTLDAPTPPSAADPRPPDSPRDHQQRPGSVHLAQEPLCR
jgi:hypothetical protein